MLRFVGNDVTSSSGGFFSRRIVVFSTTPVVLILNVTCECFLPKTVTRRFGWPGDVVMVQVW